MADTITFSLGILPIATPNIVRVNIYKQSSPNAVVASQEVEGPIVEVTTLMFPGLIRANYKHKGLEVDPDTNTVIREIWSIDIIPNNSEIQKKETAFIEAGISLLPGGEGGELFPSGVNEVVIPDWIGWDIDSIEEKGAGTLQPMADYDWDPLTGTLTKLIDGDVFNYGVLYIFRFAIKIVAYVGVPDLSGVVFNELITITGTYTIAEDGPGKKYLIQGSTSAFDITLPDLEAIVENKMIYIESGRSNHKCVKLKCFGSQTIDWRWDGTTARTYIYFKPFSRIAIFKQAIDESNYVWRVHDETPDFGRIGETVTHDQIQASLYNLIACNGASVSLSDNRRLYDEYVAKLPPAQLVTYAAWSTSDKSKFSQSDGTNFRVPDYTGRVLKHIEAAGQAGTYEADGVGAFTAGMNIPLVNTSKTDAGTGRFVGGGDANEPTDMNLTTPMTFATGKTETTVKNVSKNFYIHG